MDRLGMCMDELRVLARSARVAPMNTLSMAISPSGSQHVEAELTKRDVADPLQIDHAPLGRGVALDVALCG
jgi:hypothetical protein